MYALRAMAENSKSSPIPYDESASQRINPNAKSMAH
jgi:hypothetical protein